MQSQRFQPTARECQLHSVEKASKRMHIETSRLCQSFPLSPSNAITTFPTYRAGVPTPQCGESKQAHAHRNLSSLSVVSFESKQCNHNVSNLPRGSANSTVWRKQASACT